MTESIDPKKIISALVEKRDLPTSNGNSPREEQTKQIQALIDAVAITNPTLKDRLSLGAIWQMLQLPDSCYGWNSNGTMPFQAKCLCVINTIDLGLVPGTGQCYWLGNRFYVSAAGQRNIAHNSSDFKFAGTREYRPLNDGERKMFGLTENDMGLVLEQPATIKGEIMTAIGYGIIGADEKSNPVWGKTKKNIAMNLITRAERDMYNRYVPLRNAAPEPDDSPPEAVGQTLDMQKTTAESFIAKETPQGSRIAKSPVAEELSQMFLTEPMSETVSIEAEPLKNGTV